MTEYAWSYTNHECPDCGTNFLSKDYDTSHFFLKEFERVLRMNKNCNDSIIKSKNEKLYEFAKGYDHCLNQLLESLEQIKKELECGKK